MNLNEILGNKGTTKYILLIIIVLLVACCINNRRKEQFIRGEEPAFDWQAYLSIYPDFNAHVVGKTDAQKEEWARKHYNDFGRKEGRRYRNPNEGQAIKCKNENSGKVYRYTEGVKRHYPNPEIASSWDPNWGKFETVNCHGMSADSAPMVHKDYDWKSYLNIYPDLKKAFGDNEESARNHYREHGFKEKRKLFYEGDPIKCRKDKDDNKGHYIYRYTGGKRRFYPSPAIADSWDPTYVNSTEIDCTHVPKGDDMSLVDWNTYLNINPDLKKAFGDNEESARNHYREHGFKEGRRVRNPIEGDSMQNKIAPVPKIEASIQDNAINVANHVKCADEGGMCNMTMPTTIQYGANDKFMSKQFEKGNIACNNDTFGRDPAQGAKKSCMIHKDEWPYSY